MPMIRQTIIANATPNRAEILCVFDDGGIPRNVTVTDATLAGRLSAADSPGRAAIEAEIFAAAEALVG